MARQLLTPYQLSEDCILTYVEVTHPVLELQPVPMRKLKMQGSS